MTLTHHHPRTQTFARVAPILLSMIIVAVILAGVLTGVHVVLDFINEATALTEQTPVNARAGLVGALIAGSLITGAVTVPMTAGAAGPRHFTTLTVTDRHPVLNQKVRFTIRSSDHGGVAHLQYRTRHGWAHVPRSWVTISPGGRAVIKGGVWADNVPWTVRAVTEPDTHTPGSVSRPIRLSTQQP